jgi:methylamine dehydrogenase heavy chain
VSMRYVVMACVAAGLADLAPAAAQPPVLAAETSDVAVLPPAGPHRVFVMGGLGAAGANVVDAASEHLDVLGLVPASPLGLMALSPNADRVFVAETFYSRGNRGKREDVLTTYDGQTLKVTQEVVLPGRLLIVPRLHVVDVSIDAKLGYVYDMVPASVVHVVDLERGRMLRSVNLPGCTLAYPYGPRGFGTVCGDGTVGAIQLPARGDPRVEFSEPFFDANSDPVFEGSVIDKQTGNAWFLSFTGRVYPVQFADRPVLGESWSIGAAAGFGTAGTGVQELAWRPGGLQPIALHRATQRLFVLMHTGNHWTHKQAGTEVWVLDANQKTLLRRVTLEEAGNSIAVSQGDNPLLYIVGEKNFAVIDALTGEKLRTRPLSGGLVLVPGE